MSFSLDLIWKYFILKRTKDYHEETITTHIQKSEKKCVALYFSFDIFCVL